MINTVITSTEFVIMHFTLLLCDVVSKNEMY